MLLGAGIPNIGGPKIDPRDYKTIKCSKCGGIVFEAGYILKEIPGTLVGQSGESIIYPLQILKCADCGTIIESDIKAYKLENDINEITSSSKTIVKENKGNIFIS